MVSMLEPFATLGVLDWLQLAGSLVAFVLLIIKIREHMKQKVSLSITILYASFRSEISDDYKGTGISITADVKNKGLEPTTLSRIYFYSKSASLYDIKLQPRPFDKMDRIEANYRKEFEVSGYDKRVLSDKIKVIKGKVVFQTAHEDIEKDVTLIRKDTVNF